MALEEARKLREELNANGISRHDDDTCVKLAKRLLDKSLHQWLEDASITSSSNSSSSGRGGYRRDEEKDSDTEAALAECEVNIQGVRKLRAARSECAKRSALRSESVRRG